MIDRLFPISLGSRGWRRTLAPLGFVALLAFASAAPAETRPARTEIAGEPVASILWVGNSFFYYNNSMHGHFTEIAKAADPAVRWRGTSVTISGSGSTGTTSRPTCSPTASASTRSCRATRSSSTSRGGSSTR